ncbi:subtilisin-like serine protease [Serpentinimonas raichei]|uniref:Subtilisin-like serine protease n=1 Tax=Serpentinimonas raichei TaxID=1458425 RepID=A0A060NIT0_9BURK|nr:subtilisin-like serine protease [Serpentinimonas raichei]
MLHSTPLCPPARAARPLGLVRAGLLAGLGFLGPLLWLPPLGTAPGPGSALVWADDGGGDDGGGDDSGDDGGSAAGSSGSAADGGGSGADPAPAWGWFAAAQRADEHLPNELLALNPSSAALAYARLQMGVEVLETRNLRGLGLQVVRLRLHGVPARATLERLRAFDAGTFHLQHLYALAQTPRAPALAGERGAEPMAPSKLAIGWPAASAACGRNQIVGIVDTEVQAGHPALRGAQIRSQRKLNPEQSAVADDHGTAIAALLVGQPAGGYTGLMPRARLLAAAPFYRLPSGQTRADALGLALSLDWLVGQGAQVIGMSLAGPRNAVLDAALERARARGVVVVAAAGNGGRAAAPAFPAAHPSALAVTALTPAQAVYRRASQGEHIRFALPGADLPTLGRDGALQRRSGTSFAVPFMVALVSQSLHERQLSAAQWFSGQGMALQDLGAPGRDPVFGWGLPRLTPRCR